MVSIVIATSKIKIKVPTGIHHSKKIYEIYLNIQKVALGNWALVVKKDNGLSTGPALYILWGAFTLLILISYIGSPHWVCCVMIKGPDQIKKELVRVVGVKMGLAREGGKL